MTPDGFMADFPYIKERKISFALLQVMELFLRSEAPGGSLPPVTSEKPHDPRILDIPYKQFDVAGSK
jgi:hypothetical protein